VPEGSPFASWGRILIVAGIGLAVVGVLMLVLDRTGIVGRLPGDIVVRRKGWSLWFPITTCIVLSILLTIIVNLFRR
jgi:hypothetical protein